MSDCWICKEKAAWKLEKLNAARAAAKIQTSEQGATMAIIKKGCNYTVYAIGAIPSGSTVVEYISEYY